MDGRDSNKDSLLLQDTGCRCGCRTFKWNEELLPTNQLKKRIGRIPPETIFEYVFKHCRNRQSISFDECKELMSKFLLCSNVVYRFEDLHELLALLYDTVRLSANLEQPAQYGSVFPQARSLLDWLHRV